MHASTTIATDPAARNGAPKPAEDRSHASTDPAPAAGNEFDAERWIDQAIAAGIDPMAIVESDGRQGLATKEIDIDRDVAPERQLTGEHQFGSAMKVILANPELASTVEQISVIGEWPEAMITFRCGDDFMVSRFIDEGGKQHATRATMTGAIHTCRSVGGWLINQIAMDVANDSPEPSSVEQELNK